MGPETLESVWIFRKPENRVSAMGLVQRREWKPETLERGRISGHQKAHTCIGLVQMREWEPEALKWARIPGKRTRTP